MGLASRTIDASSKGSRYVERNAWPSLAVDGLTAGYGEITDDDEFVVPPEFMPSCDCWSEEPVRYSDGTALISSNDLIKLTPSVLIRVIFIYLILIALLLMKVR